MQWDQLCVSKVDSGLSFEDFEAFNLALLAKQGWRLLQNEGTQMKAKYFPNGNFLNVVLRNFPSFVWRSLMEGKKVLEKGGLWRVRRREKILIFEHKWVRNIPTSRPIR